MSADPYKYTVDGEKVTLDEIVARLPHMKRPTVRKRINNGHRTWAALGADTIIAAKDQRKRFMRSSV